MVTEAQFLEVADYVENTVVQSQVWDNSRLADRKKAVNRANLILSRVLSDVFKGQDIPAEILGEQAMWVLKIDDTIERSDFGMKSVWVDGTMLSISDKDNSVNPLVYKLLGIPVTKKGNRRKFGTGSSNRYDTNRWGNSYLDKTYPHGGGRWYE